MDIIYTAGSPDATCCLAVQFGLRYGIQSRQYSLCPYLDRLGGRHRLAFVDNAYRVYTHASHLEVVRKLAPVYATVRDIMTPEQCAAEGIAYYPMEQILHWAEELRPFCQQVIVIPKYDCLDQIPEHFMLGYSIPTSHGQTPVPLSAFRGRRVHLLGGAWRSQLRAIRELGEDIVSLDNNYICKIANQFGVFITPDGRYHALSELQLGKLPQPKLVALTLSFAAISAWLRNPEVANEPAPIQKRIIRVAAETKQEP